METSIESAVKIFEEVEKIRRGGEAKLTHLARNRRCLACGRDWMPKAYEPCPECSSSNTKLLKRRRKCLDCGHVWEPSALGVCPDCGSSASELHPKDDPYVRNVALPRLKGDEDFFEDQLKRMVEDHPAWEWAELVKGTGVTTIGRIIGKTDIKRVNTASEMFAHCGFGLEPDGSRQRKRSGVKINYDPQLQSNCVILGESLMKTSVRKRCAECHTTYSSSTAKCQKCGHVYSQSKKVTKCPSCGESKAFTKQCPSCGSKETEEYAIQPYGQFYLDQKKANSDLPAGHCHNRAFRHMIKLFLSHFWQTWREAEGLSAPPPYAFAILKHPSGHLITPWDMVQNGESKVTGNSRRASSQQATG